MLIFLLNLGKLCHFTVVRCTQKNRTEGKGHDFSAPAYWIIAIIGLMLGKFVPALFQVRSFFKNISLLTFKMVAILL